MAVNSNALIDKTCPHNLALEYLVRSYRGEGSFVGPAQGVVVSGIMVRECAVDPMTLSESFWWQDWATSQRVNLRRDYYIPPLT